MKKVLLSLPDSIVKYLDKKAEQMETSRSMVVRTIVSKQADFPSETLYIVEDADGKHPVSKGVKKA